MRTFQTALRITVAVLAGLLGPAGAALADPSAITSKQADEILSELRQIRQLLERGAVEQTRLPAPAAQDSAADKVTVATRESNTLGAASAPLTLIEFADYQCPFCRQFHMTVFDQLKKNFVDTGKLRYVSRDLPLPIHEHATEAARAARCAGDQQHYWEARHLFMLNQQKLERADLLGYAHDLHLNVSLFARCLDDKKYEAAVQRDAADAAEVGVMGTPTFVIGPSRQKGKFTGVKIVGAQPYSVYEAQIRMQLASSAGAGLVAKAAPAAKKLPADLTLATGSRQEPGQ
jgi:protein-disulfide isomerase